MSNTKKDFVPGTLVPVKKDVLGLGTVSATLKGTLRWAFEDDDGVVDEFLIPDSYYVPSLKIRLLSPQHWSQTNPKRGAHSDTNGERITMEWDGKIRNVPLNLSNVGFMRSAPGFTHSDPVVTALHATLPEELFCFPAHLIPPDDDDDGASEDERPPAPTATTGLPLDSDDTGSATLEASTQPTSVPVEFDLDDLDSDYDELLTPVAVHSKDLPAQLLVWHYRLGHQPFKKLQAMAKQGTLPKALAHCPLPQCSACLYGKATKRAWRSRTSPNHLAPATITRPGDCVSVDQLESSTPGLIAQLRGFLTRQRYTVATIFVDHFSHLSYVHLQRSTSAEDTLQAKRAFEAYARSKGVVVKHYHADNGRFIEKAFRDHCELERQTVSFSGVNAHFMNGKSERRIRELQDSARTMLVHAKHRWPRAITAHLWPYALRTANDTCIS